MSEAMGQEAMTGLGPDTPDDQAFDQAVIASAFERIASNGWPSLSVAAACRDAGLPLDRARARFASTAEILLRFGALADGAALMEADGVGFVGGAGVEPSGRERLFDMLMRRFDVLQQHRGGVVALLRALPADPATALMLAVETGRSMRWMLDGAGIDAAGLRGMLRVQGLLTVWAVVLRAWERDETLDLAATMAALDRALDRAGRFDAAFASPAASDAREAPAEDDGLADVIVPEDEPPPA